MSKYDYWEFDQILEKIDELDVDVTKLEKKIKAAIKKDADADVSEHNDSIAVLTATKTKMLDALAKQSAKREKIAADRERREEELHKATVEGARNGTAPSTTLTTPSTEPKWSLQSATNEMRADAQVRVHEFDPNTCNVADFLSELSRVYNIFVVGQEHGKSLIPAFIRMVKSKLTPNTLDSLRRENKAEFTTFDEMENTLYDKYATIRTPYQLLQNVWKVDMEDNESVGDTCTRLQQKMCHAATSIAASFKKKYERDMSLKEQADMFAGMRLLEMIAGKYPEVYTQLVVNKIDNLYDSQSIAAEATKLIARLEEAPSTSAAGYYQTPGGNRQHRQRGSGYRGRYKYAASGGADQPVCPFDEYCWSDACIKRHPKRNKLALEASKKKSGNNNTNGNGPSSTQSTNGTDSKQAKSFHTTNFRH